MNDAVPVATALQLDYLDEPLLRFGHGQLLADPKDGLFLFGPLLDQRKPAEIRVGVIGTEQGIGRYERWVERVNGFIPPGVAGSEHHLAFPGFEAAFKTSWP